MVYRGEDYENGYLLSKIMREQKIIGCSGSLRIESGFNSRAGELLVVHQVRKGEDLKINTEPIIHYNRFSVTLIEYVG